MIQYTINCMTIFRKRYNHCYMLILSVAPINVFICYCERGIKSQDRNNLRFEDDTEIIDVLNEKQLTVL